MLPAARALHDQISLTKFGCGQGAGSSTQSLLESERAGVIALSTLIDDVEQEELKKFLRGSRAMEQRNAESSRR